MKGFFEAYKNWIYILGGLLVVSILLSIVLSVTGLRVNSFSVLGEAESANLISQRVSIKFSNPVDEIATESVTITPVTDYSIQLRGNTATFVFQEALLANTEYKITIDDSVRDIYNKKLSESKTFEFKTRENYFYYIRKNEAGGVDQIIKSSLDQEEKGSIFSSENINKYAVSGENIAVVTTPDETKREVLELVSGDKTTEFFQDTPIFIHSLSFSKQLNSLFVLIQDAYIETQFDVAIPEGSSKLMQIDVNTKEINEIEVPAAIEELDEVIVADDGYTLIVKDVFNGDYFIFNPFDSQSAVPIGSFIRYGDFSSQSKSLLFTGFDYESDGLFPIVSLVTRDREVTQLTSGSETSLDPQFIDEEQILYSVRMREFPGSKGIFKPVIKNLETNEVKELSYDNYSLELAKVSPDGQYAIFEAYSYDNLMDDIESRTVLSQIRPNQAQLVLYDVQKDELSPLDIRGIDVQWE